MRLSFWIIVLTAASLRAETGHLVIHMMLHAIGDRRVSTILRHSFEEISEYLLLSSTAC
jgi:hypothetical protein